MIKGKALCIPEWTDDIQYRKECHRKHERGLHFEMVNKRLKKVLLKGLHPDRYKRYRSAEEFIEALKTFQ